MHAVQIQNVTKAFRSVVAVDRLSLSVREGSVYGFIGPNGSGKSTTMRMIAGIFYPDSGTIHVLGKGPAGTRSGDIGYLPEERGLYRKMRVRDLLQFHGELRGGRNVAVEVAGWLERLGLAHCAERKVETLSKGMSQKIQFIATVVPQPRLLILDEPFSGLDPVSADVIRSAILEMRRLGCTVILSTHDMSVAESLCDSIFMIFRGKKMLDGTLASIQETYGSDTIRVELSRKSARPGRTDEPGAVAESLNAAERAALALEERGEGEPILHDLPGIEQVKDMGRLQELRMAPGCDPQEVLRTLTERADILSFAVTKPSLHDIFVRIAGPQPDTEPDAGTE